MADLEKEFEIAMFSVYQRAKTEAHYSPTLFLNMLNREGGRATAKRLINASKPSDGYTALYERGRLDLTIEALVLENEYWHPLFTTDELQRAARRLQQYGYGLKG